MVEQKTLDEISVLSENNGWKLQAIGLIGLTWLAHGKYPEIAKDAEPGKPLELGEVYMLPKYQLLGVYMSQFPSFGIQKDEDARGMLQMLESIARVPHIRTALEPEPVHASAVQFCSDKVMVFEFSQDSGSVRQVPVSYEEFMQSLRGSNYYDA